MRIILIGYRGVGKSSIARILSKILQKKTYSTDVLIEKKTGFPITEYVNRYGWKSFRKIESEIIQSLESEKDCIIDCGGGVIEDQKNIDSLKINSRIIWLKASPETIKKRIISSNRPPLTTQDISDEIEEMLQKREPKYKNACNIEIDIGNKSPAAIADKIICRLK